MLKCKKCGQILPMGAGVCAFCNTEVDNYSEVMEQNIEQLGFDKCSKCGHIGEAVPEKMLRKKDWIIMALTFFSGLWVIYLIYIYMKRGDASKRNMVCPVCGTVMKSYNDDRSSKEIITDKESIAKIKSTVVNVAKDPEVRKGLKDIKKGLKDLQDTMYP